MLVAYNRGVLVLHRYMVLVIKYEWNVGILIILHYKMQIREGDWNKTDRLLILIKMF